MSLWERLTSRNALLIMGSTLFMIISIGTILAFALQSLADSALLFVGFLLISMAGLAFLAAVYNALGHDTRSGDAFGLPSGSVRALLAIAIMILFVVFGLPFIRLDSAPSRLSDEPFETVSVPCAAAAADVRRYRNDGIVAVPNYQSCGMEPNLAPLKLYRQTREYSPNQLEFGKQILTAVITLLTTIIGFYFGSQSAIAAATAARENPGPRSDPGDDSRPHGHSDQKDEAGGGDEEGSEAEGVRQAEAGDPSEAQDRPRDSNPQSRAAPSVEKPHGAPDAEAEGTDVFVRPGEDEGAMAV